MENLKALVYKGDLTPYQRALAQREIQDVTSKVLNDNKHNISDMLATTAAFMVQFSLTPNEIGKVLSLGKLGMRYNAIRKVAEKLKKKEKRIEERLNNDIDSFANLYFNQNYT